MYVAMPMDTYVCAYVNRCVRVPVCASAMLEVRRWVGKLSDRLLPEVLGEYPRGQGLWILFPWLLAKTPAWPPGWTCGSGARPWALPGLLCCSGFVSLRSEDLFAHPEGRDDGARGTTPAQASGMPVSSPWGPAD